jgi:hypothetical protein
MPKVLDGAGRETALGAAAQLLQFLDHAGSIAEPGAPVEGPTITARRPANGKDRGAGQTAA